MTFFCKVDTMCSINRNLYTANTFATCGGVEFSVAVRAAEAGLVVAPTMAHHLLCLEDLSPAPGAGVVGVGPRDDGGLHGGSGRLVEVEQVQGLVAGVAVDAAVGTVVEVGLEL